MSRKKLVKPDSAPQELPAMTGPGVERLHLPLVEAAADEYIAAKEARALKQEAETTARLALQTLLNEHRDILIKTDNGLEYPYGAVRILLRKREEKVVIVAADAIEITEE